MSTGQVILVGAGPGDPGLLTLKGQRALEEAQVVVYDRLVSPAILAQIPAGAEKINVGKESSRHTVPQEQINQLLLEKALEGKRVVRLKGGDPFLFGRGGEELELLARHGVPFQEVPGITSAIAVPAYGGIPVTHRDYCSSLHIVTGHQKAGRELEIPFSALAQTGGTLVFLMGVSALGDICQGLLAAGMGEDTPAAVIQRGTTPSQQVTAGTLATLPGLARAQQVKSPAVIVVGRVCTLGERFDWFDRLPLKGRHVVVTRPRERAGTLSRRLRDLGAQVTELPCIETVPLSPCPPLEEALAHMDRYQWLALTSPAGVAALMGQLERAGKDARALAPVKLAAVGPGTARELKAHGLRADLIPPAYGGAHLGTALARQRPAGRVLLLRAREADPALASALAGQGIPFDDVPCYETRLLPLPENQVRELLAQNPLVAFTSASTVRGFAAALGEGADLSGLTALCIGPQTQAEAMRRGFSTVTAGEATIDGMIQTILEGI